MFKKSKQQPDPAPELKESVAVGQKTEEHAEEEKDIKITTPAGVIEQKAPKPAPPENEMAQAKAFAAKAKKKGPDFSSFFIHIPLQEKVLFARHLSIAVKSGMTLQNGLKMIQEQTKSPSFKKILNTVIADTSNGMFLYESLEKYKSIFGDLFVNIVRVAENSGTLVENLNYLADELKKKQALHSKIRGAMIYPSIILLATIGIVTTLMVGVFPKILPVFSSMSIKLPITTRILIATSTFMTQHLLALIIGVIIFVIFFWIISRYYFYRHAFHHLLLHLPIFGKISVKVNSATFTRTLALLLKSGVQAIEAVNITSSTLDNFVYQHELKKAGETLRRGDFLHLFLKKEPKLFPPLLTNMIEVGENTGNLIENLEYLADFYEKDVEEILKNLSSIIEPFLLLFMGLLVGFMALSVVTPIYQISQSLTR